ncbi:MAG TPA: WbuC family cupin fold metalloprotein [Balneolales bacterium]|nr:WbuC family cupin fold metalloprotein [Balneolales bacterium]
MTQKRVALDNIMDPVFRLDNHWWNEGIKASRESQRQRMILPVHREQSAPVQRMLNFLQPDTYIRPHRHPESGATESMIVLQGAINFFTFDDRGTIQTYIYVGGSITNSVVDIEPNIWHTFIVKETDTVLFEVKRGPYNPATDKEFAAWAPEESTAASISYLSKLKEYS